MWKALIIVGFAISLAGCASFRHAAENDCVMAGYAEKDPAYQACVENAYNRRTARAAAAAFATPMPAAPAPPVYVAPPAAPSRPIGGRYLRNSYVDGMNRICVYGTATGTVYETIRAHQMCPIN